MPVVNAQSLKQWFFLFAAFLFLWPAWARGPAPSDEVPVHALPQEARQTLQLIKNGGPFPYAKDGAVFGNYERRLPRQQRGYYREFTVKTPGERDRGARRIVSGGEPASSGEYYYTEDHYSSFRRIRE
jgi:ribonuclease T1